MTTLSRAIRRNLNPTLLFPAIVAGLVAGILALILQLSFAALIFGNELSRYLGQGIGLALVSGFILALVVALTSSFEVSVASPQDSPAAVLALLVASLLLTLPENTNSGTVLATVIAALALTTILTGALFIGLGQFRLGRLVRYVPYPVVGGFLAGTGWLLLQGGINVMTGAQLTPEWLFLLAQPSVLLRWLPGVLLAVLLLVILRRWRHALITPTILIGAVLLFYAALFFLQMDVPTARARSWMLGPFPQGSLYNFWTVQAFQDAEWGTLLRQADKIAVAVLVGLIGLLFNASGIELDAQRDLDFNRELKGTGLANLVAGIAGGIPGYHLLGATTLSAKLGARSRVTGLTAAAAIAFTLLFGASLLEYFPRPVLGGLLVFLGLSFLVDWLYDAFFRLPRGDYALIVLILGVIAVFGFLPGVAVGLTIAVLMFMVNYNRQYAVLQEFSCATLRSNVERSLTESAQIRKYGEESYLLVLNQVLFFGTAQNVLDRVQTRLTAQDLPPLKELVLDFRRVPGMDSSAVASFLRLQQITRLYGIQMRLTQLTPAIQQQLVRGGFGGSQTAAIGFLPSLDHGAEWCENEILARHPLPTTLRTDPLLAQLSLVLRDAFALARLLDYLEEIEIAAGEYLVRQGERADALYIIETGKVSVEVDFHEAEPLRLRTIGAGNVIGEVGFYQRGVRSANVRALELTTGYRILFDALERMEAQDPSLAIALHKWMASVMADRLADDVRLMESLKR